MGNICCVEDTPSTRYRPIPRPNRPYSSYPQAKPKTPSQQKLEEQRRLLSDFSYAIQQLKQNAQNLTQKQYKGMFTHNVISSDNTSQYLNATLDTTDGNLTACVVKKVTKAAMVSFEQKRSLMMEYLVTSLHNSDFIVSNLTYYEDSDFLYLYFDLGNYNHLNVYTNCNYQPDYFNYFRTNLQSNIRFVAAGIITGLNYLHSLNIVYRAISNENIVISENGYPLLTNLSKLHPERSSVSLIETNPFMSPEEYRGQPLTRASDLWSLGILLYYMCVGSYPNTSTFVENQFNPIGISPELTNLINRLLVFDPSNRLGAFNRNQLKFHPFFHNFNWPDYETQQMSSPLALQSSHLHYNDDRSYLPQNYYQNTYYDSYGGMGMGMGFMATLLFVDIAALYFISEAFDNHGGLYEDNYYNQQDMGGDNYYMGEGDNYEANMDDVIGDFGGDFD